MDFESFEWKEDVERSVDVDLMTEPSVRWRVDRLGGVRLTEREREALALEFELLQDGGIVVMYDEDGAALASVRYFLLQQRIAERMGISQQRVSALLRSASMLLRWAERHGYQFGWRLDADGVWVFDELVKGSEGEGRIEGNAAKAGGDAAPDGGSG